MGCFPEKIGDLGVVRVRCQACGHSAIWTPQAAARRLGQGCTPLEAARRLKCSACGQRRVAFA